MSIAAAGTTASSAKMEKRVNSRSTSCRIASGMMRSEAFTTRSSMDASPPSSSSSSSSPSSFCHVSASWVTIPPAMPNASGSRPQAFTASIAARGGASSRCSQPPVRSSSSRAAASLITSHCTSLAPPSSERMRVVTMTAEVVQDGSMKLSGVACESTQTSSSTSSTDRFLAASLSSASASCSSIVAASGSTRVTSCL
eukprot:scaffold72489_cov75-Phaeocystis_antarctica.AAC.4